jgi:DtxR family Mn-dependent transcriptional regulator
MRHDSFNESTEMYLKTVSELAVRDEPVAISALADRLGVSPVSASEMVHRLRDGGLVDHRPYKGIILTADGRQQADGVIRSHRLWERFLADQLALPWDQVHALACRLEHATDPQVMDALDHFLGYPATCPHGNPIPRPNGAAGAPADCALAAVEPGCTVVVSRVHPETDELLAYLAELGLVLGRRVTVREYLPFHGPLVLLVDGDARYVGLEAASRVYVYPVEETV